MESRLASGEIVHWYEENGVVRVTQLRAKTGEVTKFPDAPQLGMCFDVLGRDLWQVVYSHWEKERDRRRGTRWSFQRQGAR
ncbi:MULTISPECIES: hypothetical protein [Nocardia]|uniref:hypothetical protein n=1 Tax=Nocardia TaxID=1817 RepID=UPI000D69D6A4|nr:MULTISPECIES: hypothetical protein [Nocardia]